MAMRKVTPSQDQAEWGRTTAILNGGGSAGFNKMASDTYVPPKMVEAIRAISASPDPSMVYYYDRAMGAGEYYRANNNADWFPEKMLRRDHHTFEKHAKLYRNHVTTDEPIGDVLCAVYNDALHTVDLINRAPLSKVALDDDRLKRGMSIKTSMGCAVPYDKCSICGNMARTKAEHCDHIRWSRNNLVNGRQAYMINEEGVFRDISIVAIPAAPESAIIHKIASLTSPFEGHADKLAKMFKRVPSMSMPLLDAREARGAVEPRVIMMLSHLKRADAILTLQAAVGVLRPDEYHALMHADATLLHPECAPVINLARRSPEPVVGVTYNKLASVIKTAPTQGEPDGAAIVDWMEQSDLDSYLAYRHSFPYNQQAQDRFLYLR